MKKYIFGVENVEETLNLGEVIGKKAFSSMVICLEGDLGAGKTTFTKGLAKGLDITRIVKSPTFTIIKEYSGRLPLYHMDVYRLEGSDEDLGFDEYFTSEGVTVVEWASIIGEYLPKERLDIKIYNVENGRRRIELIPYGDKYIRVCEAIK